MKKLLFVVGMIVLLSSGRTSAFADGGDFPDPEFPIFPCPFFPCPTPFPLGTFQNGDFQTGDLTAWTYYDETRVVQYPDGSGNFAAFLESPTGGLSQDFINPGLPIIRPFDFLRSSFEIELQYLFSSETGQLNVSVLGLLPFEIPPSVHGTIFAPSLPLQDFSVFKLLISDPAVLSASLLSLNIGFSGNDGEGVLLDNIRIGNFPIIFDPPVSDIPEPSTFLIIGMALMMRFQKTNRKQ